MLLYDRSGSSWLTGAVLNGCIFVMLELGCATASAMFLLPRLRPSGISCSLRDLVLPSRLCCFCLLRLESCESASLPDTVCVRSDCERASGSSSGTGEEL